MAELYDTSDFRNGLRILYEGEPYVVLYFQHVKPGKGNAFTRTRIKSLLTGRILEPTLKSGEKVGKPDVEERPMQYLYKDESGWVFMDNRTYDQMSLNEDQLGDAKNYLKDNIDASVLFYNGRAIGVTLPNAVDLLIAQCDPGIKGDTVSGALKPATLETGHVINVPLFINEGDVVKVDTRSGEYLTRVSSG